MKGGEGVSVCVFRGAGQGGTAWQGGVVAWRIPWVKLWLWTGPAAPLGTAASPHIQAEHDKAGTAGSREPVKLGQQLVERLFPFLIGGDARLRPLDAQGVYLVDKDDAGSARASAGEQVAHARGTDADDALHKLTAGEGKEKVRGVG